MNSRMIGFLAIAIPAALCLAGCGGGSSSSTPPPSTYTIGGTVTGLTAGGLVLADGSQTVSPVSGATSFVFPTAVASGTSYSATITTQPTGETCAVTSGTGTVASSNVTSVQVACVATYTIGGTIGGLTAGGLVLADGGQTVSPASGATSFTFPTAVVSGTSYSVTITTQPTGEICTVSGGTGTVASSNVTSVEVTCVATYTIGGTIKGLTAGGLVLADGSQTVSPPSGATSFVFPTAVVSGTSYSVTITTQPTGETCTVSGGTGTVSSSNVTSVQVACVPTYTIGGKITGLTADGLVLADGSQTVSPASGATSFAFPTAVVSGTNYSVTITTQPTDEICTISSGTGTVSSSNVTSVQVACLATFTIGGTIKGLTAGGLVLAEGSQTVSPSSGATSFVFPTAVTIGSSYSVTVTAQPTGETCSVINSSGTVGSSDVMDVTVHCVTEAVLYSFQGGTSDGDQPYGGLVADNSGNLYGTTAEGGVGGCTLYGSTVSCGTVFKLTPGSGGTYTESVLHYFQGGASDGSYPLAGLIIDASGNLYGTTEFGGADSVGTVFKLTKGSAGSYTESVLHSFQYAVPDGEQPIAGLIMDGSGNLYGTTLSGGTHGYGTVFKLTPGGGGSYTESVLYSFQGGTSDGDVPNGGLITDGSGNLYGTTLQGGSGGCTASASIIGCGTVFKLTPGGGGSYTESVLYSFLGGTTDGAYPYSGLVTDSTGNLYGTTFVGGPGTGICNSQNSSSGCGTVFKLTLGGSGNYTESVLHYFQAGASDGANPTHGLIIDSSGNLYGASGGGTGGAVFLLTPGSGGSYSEAVLYSFNDAISDGAFPTDLIMDGSGKLYGTTELGGTGTCSPSGCGTVFKITQ